MRLRTGFKYAKWRIVVTMDADGSMNPEKSYSLRRGVENRYDFCQRFEVLYAAAQMMLPDIDCLGIGRWQ